jgi:transcriptional regulator with XRE-family HTH domain
MTLKETRERLGKTQAEMADLLGISRNYLALIEVGKRPESPDLLSRALLIVNSSKQELSRDEWKARALAAEAKLAGLKRAMGSLLKEY